MKTNIEDEPFDEVIEGVLAKLGEQFNRTRHQVIAALLIDHIARQMAYLAVYPNDPVVFPEFAVGTSGPLENKELFEVLCEHYKTVLDAFKKEPGNLKAEDILKSTNIKPIIPSLN